MEFLQDFAVRIKLSSTVINFRLKRFAAQYSSLALVSKYDGHTGTRLLTDRLFKDLNSLLRLLIRQPEL
jgi:hypothetical protein